MRRRPRPCVIALAGPNGAGKSTVGPDLLRGALQVTEFVNADVIAQGLSAFEPDAVAIAAGRVMSARLRELASRRADRRVSVRVRKIWERIREEWAQ